MSIHIVIDGYNLIRQSESLQRLDHEDIQLGREALVEMLADYKRMRGHKITVVFDGTHAPAHTSSHHTHRGIQVVFSRRGELADTVIKRMVAKEREKALVVSSDADIVAYAAARGGGVIDSTEFEHKLLMTQYGGGDDDDDTHEWTPTTKKKGPSRRLPRAQRRSRAKIKKL